jgi:hypothetical protein
MACYRQLWPDWLQFRMMRLPHIAFLITTLMAGCAAAQDLGVRHEHAAWPSPESVLRDLGSQEDTVREKALFLIGLDRDQAETAVFEENPSSTTAKVVGRRVVTVDIAELRYAALGEDTTQQAILSVQSGPMAFAAVAVPKGTIWERIASFSCWCKYEKKPLHEAVSLAPLALWSGTQPQRFELVLRTSGGGTGVYTQEEGHYRVGKEGELRLVLSFVSRYTNGCAEGPIYCRHLEKRWFVSTAVDHGYGGVLVEAVADIKEVPLIEYDVRDLEDRHLKNISCRTYKWNGGDFRYMPFKFDNPCLVARPNP